MKVRPFRLLTIGYGLATVLPCLGLHPALADELRGHSTIGIQTVGLSAGPFFPIRVLPGQSSKLFGAAVMPSWSIILTDPIGSSWHQGRLAVGAELLAVGMSEPMPASGIGVTPKLHYTFTAWGRLRPYVEGGGGPLWTDLGGRVPEQPGQFNFVVWGGAGCAWLLTPQWAVQAGYRFVHISNAGTRSQNAGLNFGLPFVGFTYQLF